MPNTNSISITTAAGRTITFSPSAVANIEEAGSRDQIDLDVSALVNAGSAAALTSACQEGADEDRLDGWSDYVSAIVRTADNEMLAAQAVRTVGSGAAASWTVGDRVEAGAAGTEDHDAGRVIAVDGSRVRVSWDTQVMTWHDADELRGEAAHA